MRTFITLICLVVLCSITYPSQVSANAKIGVSAQHAILMDQSSGRVLYEKKANEPVLIASITKIMTAIIAIESGDLDDMITVSEHATLTEGSSIYLKKSEKISLKDLLYGLILRSGNDAATAISEHIGGNEQAFTYLMNEKARWLGMSNTHFDNPHGLDSDNHYSTAKDMAILMQYASKNETFTQISSTKSYKGDTRDYAWLNKNKLLTHLYDHSTGGKTGYTKAAGRTLVSTAEQNGQPLIAVTINASDDWKDHIQLFEWGFETFPLKVIQKKTSVNIKIRDDKQINIEAKINEDIQYPITEAESDDITYKDFMVEEALSSNMIGKRIFYLNGTYVAETPLYGKRVDDKSKGNFVQQIMKIFRLFLGDHND